MSIDTKEYTSAKDAIEFLSSLKTGNDNYIFRGQPNSNHKLTSSFAREYGQSEVDTLQHDILTLVNDYRVALLRGGLLPFTNDNLLDWMEYGRHYGLPTPSVDFTYSPYIGLFFAFDTLRKSNVKDKKLKVAIYAIDARALASSIAIAKKANTSTWWKSVLQKKPNILWNKKFKDKGVPGYSQSFLSPPLSRFQSTIQKDILQIVPFPGCNVKRIIAQQGLLLYDTLHYLKDKVLEDLICAIKPGNEEDGPTCYKLILPASCADEAWAMLEQMGITPTSMYLDPSSATREVMQKSFYNSSLNYLRDIKRYEAYDDFDP